MKRTAALDYVLAMLCCLAAAPSCFDASSERPPDASPPDDAPGDDAPPPDGPPQPVVPSCAQLPRTCGAGGASDCCASLAVPGGTYFRSFDLAQDGLSGDKAAPATVSAFRLDRYEITVGRFRAFVMAGQGTRLAPPDEGVGKHDSIAGSGWDPAWNESLASTKEGLMTSLKCNATFATWTDAPGANETRPMNCLTWYEAQAFCSWDGGYLPSEAEWNFAAAGGDQQRAYAWSSPAESLELTPENASYHDGTSCVGDGQAGCAVTDLVPVGNRGAGDGRWGHSDLAGNVWEWSLDWLHAEYQVPCENCAQLEAASFRVLRGGGFFGGPTYLRSGGRNNYLPGSRLYSVGARCARPALAVFVTPSRP
jgi:formylglycine-generating enzyme